MLWRMPRYNRTYRDVDGERIEGTWRPVFIHNGGYYLTDLKIYADGVVDCWEHVTLEEFADKVRSGWVVTDVPDGARASADDLASWIVTEPITGVDPEALIGEVNDEVARLAGRPTSTDRCLAAAQTYLREQTETNRTRLRDAYLAIPEHQRRYALGDMDRQDEPLRALAFDLGADARQDALSYFAERDEEAEEEAALVPADGPERSALPTITIHGTIYGGGWPPDPGIEVLQNNFPAPIAVAGATYPTVTHAYWALSTSDEDQRARIAETENPYQAKDLAEQAPQRAGWADARLAVMASLLRMKFRQHPRLAEVLLSTVDSQLVSNEYFASGFWGHKRVGGRHWVARLLEVVRAELAAERAGIVTERVV